MTKWNSLGRNKDPSTKLCGAIRENSVSETQKAPAKMRFIDGKGSRMKKIGHSGAGKKTALQSSSARYGFPEMYLICVQNERKLTYVGGAILGDDHTAALLFQMLRQGRILALSRLIDIHRILLGSRLLLGRHG